MAGHITNVCVTLFLRRSPTHRAVKLHADESRNIAPIAVWLGGGALRNNHHADPHSARFAARWFEFDIDWLSIRLLSLFGLARVVHARPHGQPHRR